MYLVLYTSTDLSLNEVQNTQFFLRGRIGYRACLQYGVKNTLYFVTQLRLGARPIRLLSNRVSFHILDVHHQSCAVLLS